MPLRRRRSDKGTISGGERELMQEMNPHSLLHEKSRTHPAVWLMLALAVAIMASFATWFLTTRNSPTAGNPAPQPSAFDPVLYEKDRTELLKAYTEYVHSNPFRNRQPWKDAIIAAAVFQKKYGWDRLEEVTNKGALRCGCHTGWSSSGMLRSIRNYVQTGGFEFVPEEEEGK